MYVISELRLNKFVDTEIPSNKELFQNFGLKATEYKSTVDPNTGDFAEPVNVISNTLDALDVGLRSVVGEGAKSGETQERSDE